MKTIFREIEPVPDASFTVKQERAAQFNAPFHFHQGYELVYIVKGQGKFYGGNRVMNFKSGDIYLFGPNFPHYFINDQAFVKSGELGHSIAIQFRNDSLEHVFEQLPEMRSVSEMLNQGRYGLKFGVIDVQLYLYFQELPMGKNVGINSLLLFMYILTQLALGKRYELIIQDFYPDKSVEKAEANNRMDAVYQYVLGHFSEGVTSKQAAFRACMQEAAFCRYFKRRTKKTFSQFVNTVRVTHATQLLAKSESSISAICYASGFNNVSYFNRQFKAIIGFTPLEYRKQLFENNH